MFQGMLPVKQSVKNKWEVGDIKQPDLSLRLLGQFFILRPMRQYSTSLTEGTNLLTFETRAQTMGGPLRITTHRKLRYLH